MEPEKQTWLDKIRQQFNYAPYPHIPLEASLKGNANALFIHNLQTPYYLRYQHVIETRGKVILDAGCGSGFKTLLLAEANPGARVVGIDLSEESVKLAKLRLDQQGFPDAEFYALSLDDLPALGLHFDYINCDEMLYLLPDPVAGLATLKSVLTPTGIIRTNLHNYRQREGFYHAQALFRLMGLMENNPEEFEISLVIETMKTLKEGTYLKYRTWSTKFDQASDDLEAMRQEILMNHLFQEDKGYTIPQLFAMLKTTELSLISMVNWQHWDITELFKTPEQLPAVWQTTLARASLAEKLNLYDLLHPIHRLLDFWCGHPGDPPIPVQAWSEKAWKSCRVHLHPQLQTAALLTALKTSAATFAPFDISQFVSDTTPKPVILDSTLAAFLAPLWERPQSLSALVDHYLTVRSLDPATLEPIPANLAITQLKQLLIHLEAHCYVMLEKQHC